ncbi:uncharacterized protein MKK02DRAFT_27887 [Dioszegia hungarica]|uniref:Uncharacterized protein n=1 Tax=Dioszegia hungarica TaxID=4972 RepID=A0AA38H8C8_9TREE|nr:uncharacterized protein MKK02DRAFT_27887 [Dioszegia hungarica]KAI9634729.1 hypothetical protein MKK02DRAFT_27887 [Dioszegia hungarica]
MPDKQASLDTLPHHLIHAIAAYTGDAKSVWRMWKVCRAVRLGAEPALKPYFEEREIVGSPPLTTDIFELIHKKFAKRDSKRDLGISKRSQRFDNLLAAHPSAAGGLLCPYPAVRSSAHGSLGDHAGLLLGRLRRQRRVRRCGPVGHPREFRRYAPRLGRRSGWYPVSPPHAPRAHLHLTWWGTRRSHPLARPTPQKSRYIVALLGRARDGPRGNLYRASLRSGTLSHREHLVLAGHGAPVEALAEGIIPHSPKLTTITLQISDETPNEYSDWRFHSAVPLLRSAAQCKQLQTLALYGEAAYHFGASLLSLQKQGVPGASLENLKRLFLDEIQMDADGGSIHHLLDTIPFPDLPAIEQIFWSHRQRWANTTGMRTNHAIGVAELRKVFDQYPTLQKVHWTDAYASDISADPLDPICSAAHLFCHAARPIDDQPIRPFYPIRVEALPTVDQAAVAARAAAKVPTRRSERQRVSKGGK